MANQLTAPIAVLGAGSWGTALAIQLARNGQTVHLWARDPEQIKTMQATRCNTQYLPDISFPKNLILYADLDKALQNVTDIMLVVPSHAFRSVLNSIKPYINGKTRLAWATKGLDQQRHQLLHEVVGEVLGNLPMAILSGPNFAKEVASNLPTAITIAASSPDFAADLVQRFHSKTFRAYTSTDLIGVELGGAMKNVLAIAVGITDGLGLGANAQSALITRGLAEMTRLGVALGGQRETFMGLAGLGDLVLTCTNNQSRNRRFGLALGKANSIEKAKAEMGQLVEGVTAAAEIYYLATQHSVEIPISEQIYHILYNNLSPQEAVTALLTRDPKAEI